MEARARATARVPPPLPPAPALKMIRHHVIPLVVIVRAGVVWSGVGTLAVALVVGLLLPPPVAAPSWDRGALAGRYGSGSQLLPCGLSSSRLSNYLLIAHIALNRRLADEEDNHTYKQRKNA